MFRAQLNWMSMPGFVLHSFARTLVAAELKALAVVKTAMLVGCHF